MAWAPPSHTPYQWQNAPSTATPLNATDLIAAENDLVSYIQQLGGLLGLGATGVKIANYTAIASDFVPVDTTSGAITITLPTAPADLSRVGVKIINGSNNVTVSTGGTDVINKSGGATSTTLLPNQSMVFQYQTSTGIWQIQTGEIPLSVVSANASDPLGRTRVMQTISIQAPQLGQFVFADDFGAKGDVRRNYTIYPQRPEIPTTFTLTPATSSLALDNIQGLPAAGMFYISPNTQTVIIGFYTGTNGNTLTGVTHSYTGAGVQIDATVRVRVFSTPDGSMTSGSNTLASTILGLAATDQGKSVEIVGAGPTGASQNLVGYIGWSSGAAHLFSDVGLTTPLNASTTVTKAMVIVGTDDTAAVEAAQNALTDSGGGTMYFVTFNSYWFSQVSPAAGVIWDGQNAEFGVLPTNEPNPDAAIAGTRWSTTTSAPQVFSGSPLGTFNVVSTAGFPNQGMLVVQGLGGTVSYTGKTPTTFTGVSGGGGTASGYVQFLGPVVGLGFKNMRWLGHGREVHDQFPMRIYDVKDLKVYDCTFTLNCLDGIDIYGSSQVRVRDCTFDWMAFGLAPGSGTTGNALNFGDTTYQGDTSPSNNITVEGCFFYDFYGECIDWFHSGANPGGWQTTKLSIRWINNFLRGHPTHGGGGMTLEISATDNSHGFRSLAVTIANNHLYNCGISSTFAVTSIDPTLYGEALMQGNYVSNEFGIGVGYGIAFVGSHCKIDGNEVIGCGGVSLNYNLKNSTVTGTFSSGSTTLTADTTFPTATVNVASTANFPASGAAAIANCGVFTYTGTTGTSFTGCAAMEMSTDKNILATGLNGASVLPACVTSVTGDTGLNKRDGLSGYNFVGGPYIVSGIGSGTLILSQSVTGDGAAHNFTATPKIYGNTIKNNTIHMVLGGATAGTIAGVSMANSRDSEVIGNVVSYDDGVAWPAGLVAYGVDLTTVGWTTVKDNKTTYPANVGFHSINCAYLDFAYNTVYNIQKGNVNGMRHDNLVGDCNFHFNRVIDERTNADGTASHRMFNGIGAGIPASNCYAAYRTIGNTVKGATSGPFGLPAANWVEARSNPGFNPISVVTVTVPATGVRAGMQPYDRIFYITNGNSALSFNGATIPANGFGTVYVQGGLSPTPVYTGTAPTWSVFGQ